MKKECSLVIVLILTLFQLVRADEATHRQLAEELLVSMQVPQNIHSKLELSRSNLMSPVKAAITAREKDPKKAQALVDKLSQSLLRWYTWENVKEAYIKAYTDTFSEKELRDLTEFYKSPGGQKYAEKELELMKRLDENQQRKAQEWVIKRIEEFKAEKQRPLHAEDSAAPKKSYSEGIFSITLPSTYLKVPEGPQLDRMKKQQMGGEVEGTAPLFFALFLKSYTESLFITLQGLQMPGAVRDLDQRYNNMVKMFERDLESGALLKTSGGISRITIDGVPGILQDRETAKGARVMHYSFVLPEDRTKIFYFAIVDKVDTFKANESEVGEIIKSLKIAR